MFVQTAISGSDTGLVQANGENTPAATGPADVRAGEFRVQTLCYTLIHGGFKCK